MDDASSAGPRDAMGVRSHVTYESMSVLLSFVNESENHLRAVIELPRVVDRIELQRPFESAEAASRRHLHAWSAGRGRLASRRAIPNPEPHRDIREPFSTFYFKNVIYNE